MSTGDIWKEQRRFSLQILRNFGLGRNIMEERILAEAKKLSADLIREMKSEDRVVLDLALPLQLCVGNIIFSILFGHTFDTGNKEFEFIKETLDENFKLIASPKVLLMNSIPWLRHLPLFGHFGFDEMIKHDEIVRGFLTKEVERHCKELDQEENEEPTDFIDAYLKGK